MLEIEIDIIFFLAKIFKKKIIISPHGMIDPISLNQKDKKKIALFFYQKFIFENSDLIIVNSKIEKKIFKNNKKNRKNYNNSTRY